MWRTVGIIDEVEGTVQITRGTVQAGNRLLFLLLPPGTQTRGAEEEKLGGSGGGTTPLGTV